MNIIQKAITSFKNIHFEAFRRLACAAIGMKSTYIIHCHITVQPNPPSPPGVVATTMLFSCRPWFCPHHMNQVHQAAANMVGDPKLSDKVSIVTLSRIGNE